MAASVADAEDGSSGGVKADAMWKKLGIESIPPMDDRSHERVIACLRCGA